MNIIKQAIQPKGEKFKLNLPKSEPKALVDPLLKKFKDEFQPLQSEVLSEWESQIGLKKGELQTLFNQMVNYLQFDVAEYSGKSTLSILTIPFVFGIFLVPHFGYRATVAFKLQALLSCCLKPKEKLTEGDIHTIFKKYVKYKKQYPNDTATTPQNFVKRFVYGALLYIPMFKMLKTAALDSDWNLNTVQTQHKLKSANASYKSYSPHPNGGCVVYTIKECIFLYMSSTTEDKPLSFFGYWSEDKYQSRYNDWIIRPYELSKGKAQGKRRRKRHQETHPTQKIKVNIPFLSYDDD